MSLWVAFILPLIFALGIVYIFDSVAEFIINVVRVSNVQS